MVDAHCFMEQIKETLETAIRWQDAPPATVERMLKIVNRYYMQIKEQQEWEAKKKAQEKENEQPGK